MCLSQCYSDTFLLGRCVAVWCCVVFLCLVIGVICNFIVFAIVQTVCDLDCVLCSLSFSACPCKVWVQVCHVRQQPHHPQVHTVPLHSQEPTHHHRVAQAGLQSLGRAAPTEALHLQEQLLACYLLVYALPVAPIRTYEGFDQECINGNGARQTSTELRVGGGYYVIACSVGVLCRPWQEAATGCDARHNFDLTTRTSQERRISIIYIHV